jgi:hypothetical protein
MPYTAPQGAPDVVDELRRQARKSTVFNAVTLLIAIASFALALAAFLTR